MGKTRLALEVARARDDADGPWLVELADVRDATALPSTIAATLGVSAVGGITALAAALRHRRTILLLDNCEHLVEPLAPLVTELLQICPDLRVLATSREALEAEGECVYEVPPLSAGEDGDAVRLFLDRAAADAPQWRPDPDERGLLARLCADLDGMPLAIELAAAQCKVLSPRQIAGLLDGRFGLLRGLRTNPRHETLRAAVEWSYDLLTDDEREVFQALAVFEGGFVLEAAQAVTGRADVVVHLSSLVAKSLVVVVGGDPRRYRMLETLRCYAAGRTEPERRAEFVRRHVEWVRSLADIADAALRGHLGPGWVQRLHDESANARAAMNVADPATVLRIATEFFWFWYRQGHMTEGLRYLEPAMAYFDESGPAERGPAVAGPAGSGPAVSEPAVAGAPDHAMLARAAVALALLRYLNGDQPGVLDALHRAGRHAALTDDAAARANALTTIAYFEAHGSPAAAREHGIQALHFARQAGTPGTEAQALMVLGEVERQAGRWDEAGRFLAQAQARARDCGYTWCEGSALWIEAKVELARERWQQAAAVLQSAVEQAYGNSDRTSWVAGLATLSYLWCRVGRLDEAADLAALAECQGTRIGFSAEAMDADMARYAAELRAALPAEALAAALARARGMSPADAMEVARKVPATIGWADLAVHPPTTGDMPVGVERAAPRSLHPARPEVQPSRA
jgi:predicted ATPase